MSNITVLDSGEAVTFLASISRGFVLLSETGGRGVLMVICVRSSLLASHSLIWEECREGCRNYQIYRIFGTGTTPKECMCILGHFFP